MNKFFSPHISLAHSYWKSHLQPHDFAIDMTCGNGHDTLFLCQILNKGLVYGIDIQPSALDKTRRLLQEKGIEEASFRLLHQSHADPLKVPSPPQLIAYNLGYLPGGDKTIVTNTGSTLLSLELATQLLGCGGALSITCYPGHAEGKREEEQVLRWATKLPATKWRVCHHRWINRDNSPSLFWINKYR